VKETLLNLKLHIEPHLLIVGNFNTPFSSMDSTSRQKLNGGIMKLTKVMTQGYDITDICRPFYPNTKEYTFFSAPHEAFSKTDHIVCYKANLNR
jgi:exonuclease III